MNIGFLTEGGEKIGLGHINRCVALADGFSIYQSKISFIVRGDINSFPLDRDFSIYYKEWFELKILTELLARYDIIIVDSYQISDSLLHFTTSLNHNVVFLIDSTLKYHSYGIILFPSVYAQKETYKQSIITEKKLILSGLEYLLFTREYWNRKPVKIKDKIVNIGISLGSSMKIITDELLLLVGQVYGNHININFFGAQSVSVKTKAIPCQYNMIGKLKKMEYINCLTKLDLLICNGGQTLNEALLMGLPTLSMITAENQVENIREWERIELTHGFDTRLSIDMCSFKKSLNELTDFKKRSRINEKAKNVIDVHGAKRAAMKILDFYNNI